MTGPTKKALGIAEYQLRLAQDISLVRLEGKGCPVNGIALTCLILLELG